jgi:hypothetical protein
MKNVWRFLKGKVTPPLLPTPEYRGIIMRPTVSEHADQIKEERLAFAAAWLRRMPRLPPNCEQMTVVMHYDDGKKLTMELREADDDQGRV